MAMSDLCMLPAHELGRRLVDGELSSVELLEAVLARIEQHNPALNAVVSLDERKARKAAERADTALRRGEVRGPLTGVPLTLKDGWDVAGMRTTVGTTMLDRVARTDSTVAARLKFSGAIVIGHTNVAPMLADYVSDNEVFGRTVNPWNPDRTPGGSSGGAAAAVAAGLTPLEVGSDLAGSVRLPAHFCGVYGLMATEHRIPANGFFAPPPSPIRILGTCGPIARDLADLEIALRVLSGPDGYDAAVPVSPLGTRRRRKLSSLKVAVAPSLPGTPVAASLRAQVERVAAGLSDAGAKVSERLPSFDWDAAGELFGQLLGAIVGAFDPTAELPDEHRTLAWYLRALSRRDAITGAWHEFFREVDVLIAPPAMTTAFPHPDGRAVDLDGTPVDRGMQGGALVFANLGGLPSLVTPAGTDDDGLPIGVQLVGPAWSDLRLIDIGYELEQTGVLPGFTPPPGF
jgi:amidase